ncbi:MAG: PaeR7I family type II restriction endonuclease [Scytonematopsis contorta HA4267-MV1]|nr:PaeR7I family type II restriction endonuclease [Scytonematopsis contorta HA4267-MV1]
MSSFSNNFNKRTEEAMGFKSLVSC